MKNTRLNPLNDYLFLKCMGEKGDEVQLLAFLNAVLHRTGKDNLQSVEIREDRMFSAEIIGDKTSILDVRAKTADGTKVNVEVQLSNMGNMDKRSLFYWSRDFSESLEKGQDYLELPAVININIVNFEFLPGGDFHTSFHLWEDHNRECMLSDALEIHFIDMVKFRCLVEKDFLNDPLHRWLIFLDKNADKIILKKVINMDPAIQKAQERITFVAQDKESLREYRMRERAMWDFTSAMNFARKEGEGKGIVIGEKRGEKRGVVIGEKRGEIRGEKRGVVIGKKRGFVIGEKRGEKRATAKHALKLAQRGMNVVEIADIIDLNIDEVKKIIKNAQ
ncbi:hypothetical protein SAMD00024442_4_14 [Candidatus Symbiothrix dinenymphae]|nr:hypothetical protein SAMD00024442_4_14 [Candidatus Symbiothrix dinenymphae]